jgi:hypothetical protein
MDLVEVTEELSLQSPRSAAPLLQIARLNCKRPNLDNLCLNLAQRQRNNLHPGVERVWETLA